MTSRVFVTIALAIVAGTEAQLLGFALPSLLLAAALALRLHRLPRTVRACALAALAFGVANACLQGNRSAFVRTPTPHTEVVRGTIVGDIENSGTGTSFTLLVDTPQSARLSVSVPGSAPPLGARVTIRGRLEAFDEARNPGEPSPRALAAERGLDARLLHAHILAIEPPDPGDPRLWLPFARAWASERVRERIDEPYASILAGALWGERGALPPALRDEFQDTGTVHILVTAGLHLGVIAALTGTLLDALGVGRIPASLATIAIVWMYAALSGAHLPALRAAAMASFALLARAAGREALSWNALTAAALVLALTRPASIGSLSFALSFSCVAAILLFAAPIERALAPLRLPHLAEEGVALTLATQLGTWPLTATAFLVFAPYAPFANLFVVPTVGVAMLLGIAQLTLTPIAPLAQAAANLNESLLIWIVGVVRFFASLPYAHIVVTPPPAWRIVAYDLALPLVAWLWTRERVRTGAALLACACALVAWPVPAGNGKLVVTAIDVGQADALLIRTPRGHAILVDAGGRLERGVSADGISVAEAVGERVVVPFLIRQGVRHLDAIVLSHPHGDHAGGVAPVLRTLDVGAFADSGQTYPGHAYHDALDAARERHVPIIDPRGGDIWRTDDGVVLRFYAPTQPYLAGTANDINNNSVVFRLEYRRFRMLFTGDAQSEAEERMLAHGDDLRAEVLKVGHHGSAYSSTSAFLRAVAPRAAIVSVGRDNLFGHPAPSTIQALQRAGARIYRTDRNGAVTVESDGAMFDITPFLAPRLTASVMP